MSEQAPRDRRLLRSNGAVAHSSLKGMVEAERFTDGEWMQVIAPSATIWSAEGRRERELLYGQTVCVLEGEPDEGERVFGYALGNGYVGYFDASVLAEAKGAASHVVQTRMTYALGAPDFKTQEEHFPLSLGAMVRVMGVHGRWAETDDGRFVPASHLRPVAAHEADPVAVAERFLGTPYVWGGDSALGIDCSGLVQAACRACGVACPGDSDLQEGALGEALGDRTPARGDLLFWKGHVAWVVDEVTLLHANAHHMAVAYEDMGAAIARIIEQGDGPVTARKRLGVLR
ncbi:NlpC/P60 family protein [Rhodobacteraceae bacterium D3-12]|nr:NlpC/P60 family protein [Rhodobacteraceae bacterium D3-12]